MMMMMMIMQLCYYSENGQLLFLNVLVGERVNERWAIILCDYYVKLQSTNTLINQFITRYYSILW